MAAVLAVGVLAARCTLVYRTEGRSARNDLLFAVGFVLVVALVNFFSESI